AALLIIPRQAPKFTRFVKAVRYKDVEVTIREDFIEAREGVEELKLTVGGTVPTSIDPKDKVLQLFEIDPSLAVVEVWRNFESKAAAMMRDSELLRGPHTTLVRLVSRLEKAGKISRSDYKLFWQLRDIRNASVHAHDKAALTLAEVLEFRDFVDLFLKRLELVKGERRFIDAPYEPPSPQYTMLLPDDLPEQLKPAFPPSS
uniref:hypothetical protein n=1 Tax=Geminicoccus flavidas TaxID=2506407 RepID=UPI001357EABF